MKLKTCLSKWAGLLLLVTTGLWAEDNPKSDTGTAEKQKMSISVLLGANTSYITATQDLEYYFSPTSEVKNGTGYDWGIEVTYRLADFLGISIGIHYVRKGQYSEETQVTFGSATQLHTFESKTDLIYLSFPVNARLGYQLNRHRLDLRFGPVASKLVESDVWWKIDQSVFRNEIPTGIDEPVEPNYRSPSPIGVSIDNYDVGFLTGLEYTFYFGNNGARIGVSHERGIRNIVLHGPIGEAYNRSWSFYAGFDHVF